MKCVNADGTPKPRSKWNGCGEMRVSPTRYVTEDRVFKRRLTSGAIVLDVDKDDVTEATWVSRRREGTGWYKGARVYKK